MHRLRLKPQVDAAQAIGTLRPLVHEARNLASGAHDPSRLRDEYLVWTESVETHLAHLSYDVTPIDALHTSRYWKIREIHSGTARPHPLLTNEIARQADALQRVVDDLDQRVAQAGRAPGAITVLDSNVLLEFKPPWDMAWPEILGEPSVRLVLPLRVVEELDAKKYSSSDRLAKRARALLPQIEARVGSAGSSAEIRPAVSLEVLLEPAPRARPADADEEILRVCEELPQLTGQSITLVTADTAMRLRAAALGVRTVALPPDLRRTRDEG